MKGRRGRFTLIAMAGLIALAPRTSVPAETDAPQSCSAPEELIQDEPVLPATAARLRAKGPLVIAAIGGSSTAGKAAGDGEAAYPHQLELSLHRRYPGVDVAVLNKGVAGEVAQEMLDRFDRDLVGSHATLVLWEVGVADAVQETDRDEFANTLQQGIAWLHDHDMEVMLIDMQFSPDMAAVINFGPYLDTLHEVGSLTQTYVFRRYDIMKYWSDNGVFQFTDVPKDERQALAVKLYGCLGAGLADAIAYGAR